MLEATALTKEYHSANKEASSLELSSSRQTHDDDGTRILFQNISFKAPKGTLIVVRGASGSGKSTLLRCIAQLESLSKGEITLDSKSFQSMRPEQWRSKVLYIPQKCPKFTGSPLDTLREISKLKSSKKSFYDLFQNALAISTQLKIPERLFYDDWSRLSGGEGQKMLNIISLATEPQVVLLDEPTASLDPISAGQLEDFFQSRRKDLIIFWVTHDQVQESRIKPSITLTLGNQANHSFVAPS